MRHAGVVFVVMAVLMLTRIGFAVWFEQTPTEAFASLPIEQTVGNLEGKELRFGAAAGPVWSVLTTSTSNGSVNAMHDSLNPLTGLMPLVGMWLNEDFGGVGVGFINMFIYIVLAVFLAGMMVGRTPEYLGRRIEAYEVKLAVLATLSHSFLILGGAALFAITPWGAATLNNIGAHGFSEILYEFSSASANNGSGFEGLGDNTVPWNIATGLVMLLSRFIPIILPLAIAGSLAAKRPAAESVGTLGTESGTFGIMLLVTIVIVGALTSSRRRPSDRSPSTSSSCAKREERSTKCSPSSPASASPLRPCSSASSPMWHLSSASPSRCRRPMPMARSSPTPTGKWSAAG